MSSPYTPFTAMGDQSFTQQLVGVDVPMLEPQRSELDVPTDIDILQDLSSYTWDTNSIWPTGSETLLGDDFNLSSIPATELGDKLTEDLIQSSSPLEFGQDISHVLEGCTFLQDTMASFEEMIAPGFMF